MIRVTVEDLTGGEPTMVREIEDDYLLVCAGNRDLDSVQAYMNGTVVLTIKRRTLDGGR